MGFDRFRPAMAAVLATALVLLLAPVVPTRADEPVETEAQELTEEVRGTRDFALPLDATHVALHWPGQHDARVEVAFSQDGSTFGKPIPVAHDEVGEQREDGRTYGALMAADGSTTIRVSTDRPIPELSVLVIDAAGATSNGALGFGARTAAITTQPAVIPRAGWGADESLRLEPDGDEIWPREFYPVQKLVVHHTAGTNNDADPAATIRAIYYYHAVTQGWGDIGYNFLIDAAGRVYEGRASRTYAPGVAPSGDDTAGRGVVAGHARGFNAGSVGIGLLGTFDTVQPTASAREALMRTLSWAAAHHRVNPRGATQYVNPINAETKTTANIGGHRDYNSTACPGGALYGLLPSIRQQVAVELVERMSGRDRYATAAAASAAFFPAPVSTVFVATGIGFPDSIAGGPAAALLGSPILLVHRDVLPAATASELSRLRPDRIVVLGGPGAVSDAMLSALSPYATQGATRVFGATRYETATEISRRFFDRADAVFVATGSNFPDALSGGPAAARLGAPILFVRQDEVPAVVADEIAKLRPDRIYVLGGSGVISENVRVQLNGMAPQGAMRVAGNNRYETSAAVAATFFPSSHASLMATGTNFPDALAGASPAARLGAPMLLVGSGVPASIDAQLRRLAPFRVVVLGGPGVVGEGVMTQVRNALGLP